MRDSSAISRSFVVSFFTQRHPQTKTNITDRNDGLIDGTKWKSRWDFEELKDFISTNRFLLEPHWIRFPERLLRQLLVNWTWSYKNLAQKNMHILYIRIWHKAAQAVDLASLLPLPVALKRAQSSAAISEIANVISHQGFCLCSDLRWRNSKFVQEKTVYFIFLNQCFLMISFKQSTIPWLPFAVNMFLLTYLFMHFKTPGGGVLPHMAYVCDAVKGMVFKQFTLG